MAVWILSIALGVLTIYFLIYKNQIRKLSIQLKQLESRNTSQFLVQDIYPREINKLILGINQTIEAERCSRREACRREEGLKRAVANISHDIRTPLTSLDGYFQLMNETDNLEDRERYSGIIRERLSKLNAMLEELFLLQKLEDEDYMLPVENCNLNDILLQSIFAYCDEFEKRGIQPEINLGDMPIYIQSNGEALGRAFENIVKNAFVHGAQFFRVIINDDDDVAVIFENNLLEDKEIDISMIFQRFYKYDSSRNTESSGLGLNIVAAYINKLGGEVEAKITDGTFRILVKLRRRGAF